MASPYDAAAAVPRVGRWAPVRWPNGPATAIPQRGRGAARGAAPALDLPLRPALHLHRRVGRPDRPGDPVAERTELDQLPDPHHRPDPESLALGPRRPLALLRGGADLHADTGAPGDPRARHGTAAAA